MSFLIKDDEVREKYKQIWDVIKNKLSIKFHSKLIYDQTYLKAKVREFNDVRKTNCLGNDNMQKENMHYTFIACRTIDSVMRMDKKTHSQVYLEEWKFRIKKMQMSRFINTELKSDSDSHSDTEVDSKSDTQLMAKLKSDSDSE